MGRGRRGRRTKEMVNLARARVRRLYELAEKEALAGNPERADRYCLLAWKVATRYNVRIPADLKFSACRKCHTYFVPGTTSRVRINRGRRILTCEKCGWTHRMAARPKQ